MDTNAPLPVRRWGILFMAICGRMCSLSVSLSESASAALPAVTVCHEVRQGQLKRLGIARVETRSTRARLRRRRGLMPLLFEDSALTPRHGLLVQRPIIFDGNRFLLTQRLHLLLLG